MNAAEFLALVEKAPKPIISNQRFYNRCDWFGADRVSLSELNRDGLDDALVDAAPAMAAAILHVLKAMNEAKHPATIAMSTDALRASLPEELRA